MRRLWAWCRRWFWPRPVAVAPGVGSAPVVVVNGADDPFTPSLARSPFGYRYRRTAAYKDW